MTGTRPRTRDGKRTRMAQLEIDPPRVIDPAARPSPSPIVPPPRELVRGEPLALWTGDCGEIELYAPHRFVEWRELSVGGRNRTLLALQGVHPWQLNYVIENASYGPPTGFPGDHPGKTFYRFAEEVQFHRLCPDCRGSGQHQTETIEWHATIDNILQTFTSFVDCPTCRGALYIPSDPFNIPEPFVRHYKASDEAAPGYLSKRPYVDPARYYLIGGTAYRDGKSDAAFRFRSLPAEIYERLMAEPDPAKVLTFVYHKEVDRWIETVDSTVETADPTDGTV